MLVKAKPGERCPKEGKPRDYITDDPKGTVVPDTVYYRRLVDDGSLEEVPSTKSSAPDTSRSTRSAHE